MRPHHTSRSGRAPGPRVVVLIALVASSVLLGPRPAVAHTELVGSTPAAGDVVSLEVDRLMLAFDTELLSDVGDVTVVDSTGAEVTVGDAVVVDRTLEIGVAMGEPGRHEVSYRVTGSDGHAVVGTYAFDAAPPAASDRGRRSDAGAPVPAATSDPVPTGLDRPASSGASAEQRASLLGPPWVPWAILGGSAIAVLAVARRLSERKIVERVDDHT